MKKLSKIRLQNAVMLENSEMKAICGGSGGSGSSGSNGGSGGSGSSGSSGSNGGSGTFSCYALNDELHELHGWGFETSYSWCSTWNALGYDCRCYAN